MATVARRTGAGSTGHRRSVAPRSVRSRLVAPFATSWTTANRFDVSRSYCAPGRRESAVGRAANSRRTAQARTRRVRAHRVALPARTAEETVTDLAHIYCESPWPVRMRPRILSPDVSGDDLVDASPSTCRPLSSERLPAPRPRAARSTCLGPTPRSWRTLHSGSPSRPHGHAQERRPGSAEDSILCSERAAARATTRGKGRSDPNDCANGNCDDGETVARRQSRSVRASSGRWSSALHMR